MFDDVKSSRATNNHSMKEPGFKPVSLAASSGLFLLQSVSCRSLDRPGARPRPQFSRLYRWIMIQVRWGCGEKRLGIVSGKDSGQHLSQSAVGA